MRSESSICRSILSSVNSSAAGPLLNIKPSLILLLFREGGDDASLVGDVHLEPVTKSTVVSCGNVNPGKEAHLASFQSSVPNT